MRGLTDREQAIISLISAILISVGGISVPAGAPWWIALTIALAGAVGLAVKEALGIKK